LSDWELGADPYDTLGHRDECEAIALKWGQRHYDLFSDFLTQVSEATYTVAQLMRDIYHPTYVLGGAYIASKLVTKLLDTTPANAATAEIEGRVVNYLFGEPTVGSWSFVSTVNTVGPLAGPVPRIAGLADQGLQISSSGKVVTFPDVECEQIWLQYYSKTGGGTGKLYVDRGTEDEVEFAFTCLSDYNNYPKSYLAASGLSAGPHTVEIETTSAGPVCILGITAVGVP
jgi:hypothetical protein